VFALCDLDAFYVSVEQVFAPGLRGRPVLVLSNNDGCTISRSSEAKALGIRMGQPAHELAEYVRGSGLVMRSANFTLYGDMSRRVMSILRDALPQVEQYSVDESWLNFTGVPDRVAFAQELRERVHRWTGLANCIGLGPTKTVAKLSNRLAKRGAGVVDLSDAGDRAAALEDFPVEDVWGVGQRSTTKLASMGITTAAQLRDAPADLILSRFGVVMARTQRELQGHACMSLEDIEPDRKQIMVSRSFGSRVEDPTAVAQAISTFTVRACEKMRTRGLAAGAVWVFANTDVNRPELKQHHPSRALTLPYATQDTSLVLGAVRSMLDNLLRKGCGYKRAGVALMDLARPEDLQSDLFGSPLQGNEKLMVTLDRINQKFGRGTAGFASTGWKEAPAWGMRQKNLSACFTTRWADIPSVVC